MHDQLAAPNYATVLSQASFQRPRQGNDIIARPRLSALLAELRRLTLVSAPDGYGKTTLVSSWLETLDISHAWLSLSPDHNDPNLFVAYFLTALRALVPGVGHESQSLLVAKRSTARVLAEYLLGELEGIERPIVMVLDNYDAIDASDVHGMVEQLVHLMPPSLCLVLITRRDPTFSLTSLRAYGRLTEIRTNALRFTPAETAEFLRQMLGWPSSEAVAHLLQERSEGWIAGLHVMALHLRGQADVGAMLHNYPAVDRFAVDYLAAEVLQRQPPNIQQFLLTTSILESFCVPLCAAVIGESDGAQAGSYLDYLLSNNLFTDAAGDRDEWYSYQQLFRQVLLNHLAQRMTEQQIAALHARASAWYAREGLVDAAIRHAQAAGDMAAAVSLLAQTRQTLMNREEWRTLRRLLNFFDRATIETYPDLLLSEAWLVLNEGSATGYVSILDRIDRLLGDGNSTGVTHLDHDAKTRLRIEADVLRSQELLVLMRPHEAIELANATMERIPREWQAAGSFLVFSLAGAYQMTGDLACAYSVLDSALTWPQAYPSVFHTRVQAAQCMLQWVAADLDAMLRTTVELRSLAEELRLAEMRAWAHYFAGSIYYQWGELDKAEEALHKVVGQPSIVTATAYANAVCGLALTYQAQARADDARSLTASAMEYLASTNNRMYVVVEALAVELALRQGDMRYATQWAIRAAKPFPLTPAYAPLALPLTRLKVLLALNQAAARKEALLRLVEARDFYRSIHNVRFLIETLALLAWLYAAEKNNDAATEALTEAVLLAQPGALVRVFADIGPDLLPALQMLRERNVAPAFVSQVIAAMRREHEGVQKERGVNAMQSTAAIPAPTPEPQSIANVAGALPELLTPRELDVLILLAQRITNREISRALGISTNTVKQHIGNLLGKLEVADRRQAIVRATELGILPPKHPQG